MLEFVAHHLELDESDVIHDLLAFLAEQMIELNKQKQAETKRFLGWLEGELAIRPRDGRDTASTLSPARPSFKAIWATTKRAKRRPSWTDFFYRLHQNRGRLGVSLEQVKGEIEAEYEKSLAVLLPSSASSPPPTR